MINSMTMSLWLVALACALLMLLRAPVLRWLGPRVQYSLWAAVPIAAVLPWLPRMPTRDILPLQFSVTPDVVQNAEVYVASQSYLGVWIWAIGAGLLIGWMISTTALFYRQLRTNENVPTPANVPLQACQLSQISSPAIIGFFRPRLLLPIDFYERFTPRQQALIIAHERLHWQRGDLHFNVLAYCLLAINWFNPLAWLAYRCYRQDQELACDAVVLANNPNDRKAYGQALLISSLNHHQPNQTALFFGTPHLNQYGAHPMKQRIQHLATQHGYSKWPLIALIATAAATWLFLFNPATAEQFTQISYEAVERPTPTPIVRVNPRYPEAAVEQGLEGTVMLRFDITSEGTTDNIWVELSTSNEIFHDAASDALKRWRFDPRHQGRDYRVAIAFEIP